MVCDVVTSSVVIEALRVVDERHVGSALLQLVAAEIQPSAFLTLILGLDPAANPVKSAFVCQLAPLSLLY